MKDAAECSLCGSAVVGVPLPADWPGITSDNRPWKTPGLVISCLHCGHVQKAATAAWRADVARVYAEYALYHLSNGVEQVLFSGDVVETKSARILDRFAAECGVAAEGVLLDVGCGHGSLLRAFAARHRAWRLHGHEQDTRARAAVLAQPGVEGFHTGAIHAIGRRFDLVTIVHVFEHVFEPLSLLREVGSTLAPGGRVLIQVPDTEQNPFDLMVVDHRSHFFTAHLLGAARTAGYAVERMATDWIAKEITVVLTPAAPTVRGIGRVTPDPGAAPRVVTGSLEWLQAFVGLARQLGSAPDGLAIFGTANAATWLASIPGIKVRFFVDEDPNKIGRTHLGHPILAPAEVPSGVPVLLAFPSAQAITVRTRLAALAPQSDWRVV